MAFIDSMGAATRGVAQGAVDFNNFMQYAANVNQLTANDKQRRLELLPPTVGLAAPTASAGNLPPVYQAGVAPALPGSNPVGKMPSIEDVMAFRNTTPGAPVPGVGPVVGRNGIGAGAGSDVNAGAMADFRAGRNPGDIAGAFWEGPADLSPNVGKQYVGPKNSPIQNDLNSLDNLVFGGMGSFLNGAADLVIGSTGNLIQQGFTPADEYARNVRQVGLYTTPEDALDTGAPATAPGAPAPASPVGAPGGSLPVAAGLPVPGSATNVPRSATTEEYFPSEVRNAMISKSDEEFDYVRDMAIRHRETLTKHTNQQLQVAQDNINKLSHYANAARAAGNSGNMKRYLDEADAVSEQSMLLQQNHEMAMMDSDLELWTQQAMRAERDFIAMGDPSRMTQIMAAYGYPIALEEAGDGNYRIIDITGDGEGRRRKGVFTPGDVAEIFMSTISDQFRAQKLADRSAREGKIFDSQLKRDEKRAEINDQMQADLTRELQKYSLSLDEYQTPLDNGNGTFTLWPKRITPDSVGIIFNPDPQDTDGSGVPDAMLSTVPFSQMGQ